MKHHLGETFKPASHIYSLPLKNKKIPAASTSLIQPEVKLASMATIKIPKWPRSVSVFDLQF